MKREDLFDSWFLVQAWIACHCYFESLVQAVHYGGSVQDCIGGGTGGVVAEQAFSLVI